MDRSAACQIFSLTPTTTFEIDNASAVTNVTGAIAGTGGLTKTGNGALLLTRTNTYSGGTTISAGTLEIGNGGTNGSITGDVTDNGTLTFDLSNSVTFSGAISGSGKQSLFPGVLGAADRTGGIPDPVFEGYYFIFTEARKDHEDNPAASL